MNVLKFLFITYVVIELLVFVLVAKIIGILAAILLIILSMVVGGGLMRSEGYHTLQRTREEMTEGKSPAKGMLESLSIALGGFLMIIPGFITSIIGIFLIIPGIRRIILQSFIGLKFTNPKNENAPSKEDASDHQGRTIDGEFKKGD